MLIEAIITELVRQKGAIGKVKDLGAKLIKRINWLKVAKHGSGLAFTLLTGLPSPDMLESIIGGLKSTASDVANLKPEEIRARIDQAASFFKPAEDGTLRPKLQRHCPACFAWAFLTSSSCSLARAWPSIRRACLSRWRASRSSLVSALA